MSRLFSPGIIADRDYRPPTQSVLSESSLEQLSVTTSEPLHLGRGLATPFHERTSRNSKVQALFHHNRYGHTNCRVLSPAQTTAHPNGTMRHERRPNPDLLHEGDRCSGIYEATFRPFPECPELANQSMYGAQTQIHSEAVLVLTSTKSGACIGEGSTHSPRA